MSPPRPALVCHALLAALDTSDGRRRCLTTVQTASPGAARAMAREVLAEWRLAAASADFRESLAAGAPSEDRG